jgi:hypothetical protein
MVQCRLNNSPLLKLFHIPIHLLPFSKLYRPGDRGLLSSVTVISTPTEVRTGYFSSTNQNHYGVRQLEESQMIFSYCNQYPDRGSNWLLFEYKSESLWRQTTGGVTDDL